MVASFNEEDSDRPGLQLKISILNLDDSWNPDISYEPEKTNWKYVALGQANISNDIGL